MTGVVVDGVPALAVEHMALDCVSVHVSRHLASPSFFCLEEMLRKSKPGRIGVTPYCHGGFPYGSQLELSSGMFDGGVATVAA
jgi:hypothetical protein